MGRHSRPMPCGCYSDGGVIIFCDGHQKTQRMATVLNAIRKYYLESEDMKDCPFVKKIDELIDRRADDRI